MGITVTPLLLLRIFKTLGVKYFWPKLEERPSPKIV